ncbi:hypothetical protein F5050DRAFT_1580405 [Lentinula boryana]|uniref:Uncharacterized protein n=2 Tax=Lentinula TaxID=5352 RepID=A0AA38PSD7_9AGAR|nr:hypothetical protein GGU11DRAFT_681952 [Lentinula aff. detonsa]KAJ3980869.1 hypothetical protein F5890DRAFT_1418777 [Lentinula detonsa]KAJ3992008.1 hypothetical protein F5050DRAFT_1580405 [Lentinula boryana]
MALFERALRELGHEGTDLWHRRGHYFTKIFGISFGGGQRHPGNFLHSQKDEDAWIKFSTSEEVVNLARRIDNLLACYFPKIHTLYCNVLDDLCKENPALRRNWEGCCFGASSLNFTHAVTNKHRDFRNLLFGQCAVWSCGSFDYQKGGHLIVWDLNLVIEFPPGSVALLPSALLSHSNTAIGRHEQRHSMTFFSASGLFRWRHNNFMSDKDFCAGASHEERMKWDEHRERLWETGVELLTDM